MSRGSSKWTGGILVSLGIFMCLLDTTIVDIVLPRMRPSLSTDLYGVQWVVIIYFVGSAIAMIAAGWAASRFDPKLLYLGGLAVFLVTSLLCGAAWSLPVMLGARFVQGLAEGLVVPVGMLILYELFPPEEKGIATGLFGLSASFAPAVGPTLGGLITEHLDWRWVFYVNLPVGIASGLLLFLLLKPMPRSEGRRLDVTGFALLSIALAALIVMMGKGQQLGWLSSDLIVGLLVVTILAAVAAVLWLRFAREPLMPRRLFTEALFRRAMLVNFLISFNAYGLFLLLPIFLQDLRGLTTLDAGLVMLPGSLVCAVLTLVSGVLSDRTDPHKVGITFILATGVASLVFGSDPETPRQALVHYYLLWGAACGGTFPPVVMIGLKRLRHAETGDGTTLINTTRLVAGSIATAFATSLLSKRIDAYEQATAHFLEPGRVGVEGALAQLAGGAGPWYQPEQAARAAALGRGLVHKACAGWAFGAVYDVLALFMFAGAAVLAWSWYSEYRRAKRGE